MAENPNNKIVKVKTVSQLPTVKTLGNQSLLLVSDKIQRNDGISAYQSVAITGKDFNDSVYKSVATELSIQHGLHEGMRLDNMEEQLSYIVNGHPTFTLSGKHHLTEHPLYTNGPLSSYEDTFNAYSVNLEDLKNFSAAGNALMLNSGANYTTQYNNVEDNEYPSGILSGIGYAPDASKEYHNVYIFKIKGYESNEWVCPAHGMFTCYGWVDEKNGAAKNNSKRWIALEGKFIDENENVYWKIIQLQPFIPNEFCSYVSFSFPVNKGMVLRLRSGFNVGTNSDKYSQVNGSLTNHLANAFVGGVYSKFRWDFGTYSDTAGEDVYVNKAEFTEEGDTIRLNLGLTNNESVNSNPITLPDTLRSLNAQKANDNSGIIITANNKPSLSAKIESSDLFTILSNDILNMFPYSIVQTITDNTKIAIGTQSGSPVLSSNVGFTVATRPGSGSGIPPTVYNTISTQNKTSIIPGSSCSRSWSGPESPFDNREAKPEDSEYFKTVSELDKELKEKEDNGLQLQTQPKKSRRSRKKA